MGGPHGGRKLALGLGCSHASLGGGGGGHASLGGKGCAPPTPHRGLLGELGEFGDEDGAVDFLFFFFYPFVVLSFLFNLVSCITY